MGAKDRPMDLPVKEFGSMTEYAAVVYAKGGLFFDALRTRLGEQTFRKVIREYYRRFAFKIAQPSDLMDAFVDASVNGRATRQLVRRWLKETHADQDIAGVSWTTVLQQLAGHGALDGLDPRVRKVIEHRGLRELARLVDGAIASNGELKGDVDYGALLDLASQFLDPTQDDAKRIMGVTGRLLSKGKNLRASDVVREVGGELAGKDPQAQKLVQAFGLLLDVVENMDEAEKKAQQR